jgi:hypothetical protein
MECFAMSAADREPLELAAKAFWSQELADDEVTLRYSESDEGVLYLHADNQDHEGRDREFVWNPLHNGHQTLELATKLHMHLGLEDGVSNAWLGGMRHWTSVRHDGDPDAATRRAIVLVAAAIGRLVP